MKRIREITAIHYRRSIKSPASPSVQNPGLQSKCPVCSAPLEAILVSDPWHCEGLRAPKISFRVVRQQPDARSDKDSAAAT
jgi:hypothetical protein